MAPRPAALSWGRDTGPDGPGHHRKPGAPAGGQETVCPLSPAMRLATHRCPGPQAAAVNPSSCGFPQRNLLPAGLGAPRDAEAQRRPWTSRRQRAPARWAQRLLSAVGHPNQQDCQQGRLSSSATRVVDQGWVSSQRPVCVCPHASCFCVKWGYKIQMIFYIISKTSKTSSKHTIVSGAFTFKNQESGKVATLRRTGCLLPLP